MAHQQPVQALPKRRTAVNPFDTNEHNATLSLGAESSLTDRLALRVVAQDRYQFNVPADRKRHDLSLTSSVIWNF